MSNKLFYIIENTKVYSQNYINKIKETYSKYADECVMVDCKNGYIREVLTILKDAKKTCAERIIFISNKLIGPIYPLEEIFEKMNKRKCDFWTLYKTGKNIIRKTEEHFQFDFCVFNASFFNKISMINGLVTEKWTESEEKFSDFLFHFGFMGETYINTDDIENGKSDYRINATLELPYLLLKKYKFPYIKYDALIPEKGNTIEIQKLMKFLRSSNIFSINIIWDYVLKTANIADVYSKFSLNYICASSEHQYIEKSYSNVALLIHLYYEDLVSESVDYISAISNDIDIYISTGNEKTYQKIKREIANRNICVKEIRKIENRGRDVASLLYYCKDLWNQYKILGFLHDKKSVGNDDIIQGDLFRYTIWENLLSDRNYVLNLLNRLEEEDQLGLIVPPVPKHGTYRNIFWESWGENYENVKTLAKELGLQTDIDKMKKTLALSTCFWCKTKAFKKLYEHAFDIREFDLNPFPQDGTLSHAIERIFPFVAQDAGYYTASAETQDFAAMELIYYYDRMPEIRDWYEKYCKELGGLSSLKAFIQRYQRIYVYGCGQVSNEVTNVLRRNNIEYDGYVVTKKESNLFYDKPVFSLEEIAADQDTGIIVAIGIKFKPEIEKLLQKKGVDYYLWRQ